MAVLTLIAGPNGSGKSTLTRLVSFEGREHLLDPDAVARDINSSNPSAAAIEATLMADARSRGYEIHLAFIALDSPDESIARIQTRTDRGGHFIPDVDVKRRYTRSLANLVEAIRLAHIARIYDNSGDQHRAVLLARAGVVVWKTSP